MPIKRPPASQHIRTVIAASCVVSGLAFMLGQGVAAYQATMLQPRLASLVSQIQAQANEQMSIAHGETPTPTVQTSKQGGAATTRATKRTSTASTMQNAALVTNTPTPGDAKDNQGHDKHDKQDRQGNQGNQDPHDKANHDGQGNQGKHDGQAGNTNSPSDPGQSGASGNSDSFNFNFNTNNNEAANP